MFELLNNELNNDESGIFQLPTFSYLINTNFNSCANKLEDDNTFEIEKFIQSEYTDLKENITSSVFEADRIIRNAFNKDTFSIFDSTFQEEEIDKVSQSKEIEKEHVINRFQEINNFIFLKNKKYVKGVKNCSDEVNYSHELSNNNREVDYSENLKYDESNINDLENSPCNLSEKNKNLDLSEIDSFDDNISVDCGFDDYFVFSEDNIDEWKNGELRIEEEYSDFSPSELNWPEEESGVDINNDISDNCKDVDICKIDSNSINDINNCNCSEDDNSNHNDNSNVNNVIFSNRKQDNYGELSRASETDVPGKLICSDRVNKSGDSSSIVKTVNSTREFTKIRKWLNMVSGNRIRPYLKFLTSERNNSSSIIGSNTVKYMFKGVFRRGIYCSGSFNSNLVNSFGGIINTSDRAKHIYGSYNYGKKIGEISSFGSNLDHSYYQETRKSLKQRNLPMKIPTRYQINNKTRIRDNDVGVVWLIREIYLSLTTQVIKISMSFDGMWLILGSQDGRIRQWKFREEDLYNLNTDTEPLFNEKEDLLLDAHINAIISLQWDSDEKSHRFLSSSMDRTVKLWQAGNTEPCAVINCPDWPTSVSFHPMQKNIIFIGSLDASVQIIRLIPELITKKKKNDTSDTDLEKCSPFILKNPIVKYNYKVIETIRVQDLLTALSISPNGKYLACGFKDGGVAFYDARTLKYRCDVDCRNRRGKSSKGKKVSGISWKEDNKSVLVTTNDSRIRLFNFSDLSTFVKFKGHINKEILLSAQISNDEKRIVCGSENGYICIWNLQDNNRDSSMGSIGKFPNRSNNKNLDNNNQFNIRRGPTNQCIDSFRAFEYSLTSMILAPPSFTKKIIRYFKSNSRKLPQFNYPKFTNNNTEKNTHIFIAANRNGQIRIFVNLPN